MGESYIWVRRVVDLQENLEGKSVYLDYSHDDDVIIYINGIKVVDTGNSCMKHALVKLSDEVVTTLKRGKNLIAVYCHNRVGNSLLDFGLMVEHENYHYFDQTAQQITADVQAMQTHYKFICGPANLNLTFTAPLFLDKLDLISRPVNYLSYEIVSNDNEKHEVELYFEASSRWALDVPYQKATVDNFEKENLCFVRTGSVEQNILKKKGDDVRIDWGYFYMAGEKEHTVPYVGDAKTLRQNFAGISLNEFSAGENDKLALVCPLGDVKKADGYLMLGYDDIYSVQYFGENLRPYWNRNGDKTIVDQFIDASKEYKQLMEECATFDNTLISEATTVGGKEYAELCALAYRQAIAAHKLVEASNGDMPIEECGNMLIVTAAIAAVEGNAKYAELHWETLTTWADYLAKYGLDPENQLCTDDFAGHFAHNANLSIKAILGIASYGYLAQMLDKPDLAEKYMKQAQKNGKAVG